MHTLEAIARSLNSTPGAGATDVFNFDHNVLRTMPELRQDFWTPPIFQPCEWHLPCHLPTPPTPTPRAL